jgi:hypothetical protein
MKKILSLVVICFILGIVTVYSFKYYCLKHQPIKIEYPKLPIEIERFIRRMDRFVCFTSGIMWYEAIEKKTGEKYLVNIDSEGIWVKPRKDEEGGEWQHISNEDYLKRFNSGEEKEILMNIQGNRGNFKKGLMNN